MPILMPAPMFLVAFLAALVPAIARTRQPTGNPRLVLESFGLGITAVAMVQFGWLLLWLTEGRW